jgi:Na+-translocating ferredoxin:NAD+ oxidoreductase RnfC subunit
MKQREITDKDNVRWTCVQAYSGTDGEISEKISELSENDEGEVPVVCTPSGGAKSVRLQVSKEWEGLSDEELLSAIEAAK